MKIVEFNEPEPEPIPEPTFEETIRAEFEAFGKPTIIAEAPAPIVKVDELAEKFRSEFNASLNLSEEGRIVKGVNTTQDVGVDEIKIQAKKMGFTVTSGGVPEIPKNGVPKLFEGIERLDELKMAPGHLQKAVTRILKSANPMIGIEFEVIIPRDSESNPDIEYTTNLDDIKEFFTYNSDDDFSTLQMQYDDWVGEKGSEWTISQVEDTLNNPTAEATEKKAFMVDEYVTSTDATDIIGDITGDEEDFEMTEEIADETLARADQIYKANGPADEWPTPSFNSDPFVRLYYEIFVDDKEEADAHFNEFWTQEFYNAELPYNDHTYSVGAYLKSMHLNSMGDVFREFEDTLTWTGGAMGLEDFDEQVAYEVSAELEDLVGEDVSVEGGDSYGEADTSTTWVVTSDVSIHTSNDGDAALEIITPKMEYTNGIETLGKVFDYLKDKNAYANESTGIHINVSLGNVDHDDLNYAKLVVMLGDSHILKQYGREFNEFAENALTNLGSMMDAEQGYTRDKAETAKSFANMMAKMKSDLNNAVASSFENLSFGKFNSIGIKDDYIEFRAGGGSNYLDDVGDIVDMINRFVVAYAVAADPDAYKNEYGKKLYKLASNVGKGRAPTNSMELFAKFSSGMITKDELINKLKVAKAAKEPKEPVDTGHVQPEPTSNVINDAIEQLSFDWSISVMDAREIWKQGMEVEMERFSDSSELLRKRRAVKEVFNNLKDDIGHYKR